MPRGLRLWLVCVAALLGSAGCEDRSFGIIDDAGASSDGAGDGRSVTEDSALDLASGIDVPLVDAGLGVLSVNPSVISNWLFFPRCDLEAEQLVFSVTNSGHRPVGPIVAALVVTAGVISVVGDECSGLVLVPGATCLVTLRNHGGTPGGATEIRGALNVRGAGAESVQVPLGGAVVYGDWLALSRTPVDFGEIALGDESSPMTVTLYNHGCFAVTATTSFGGTDPTEFRIVADGCNAQKVAASSVCTVDVVFRPTVAKKAQGLLNFAADIGGFLFVSLIGTGITR